MNAKKSYITVFQMSIMTIITIAGLRGLPAMAIMGWSSVVLYLIPAVMFFIPTALVAAELGATMKVESMSGQKKDLVSAGDL